MTTLLKDPDARDNRKCETEIGDRTIQALQNIALGIMSGKSRWTREFVRLSISSLYATGLYTVSRRQTFLNRGRE